YLWSWAASLSSTMIPSLATASDEGSTSGPFAESDQLVARLPFGRSLVMRLLPVSATYTLPAVSTATSRGSLSWPSNRASTLRGVGGGSWTSIAFGTGRLPPLGAAGQRFTP